MKNKKMSIRIAEQDLLKIQQKAKTAKRSLTDYVTQACLGQEIIVIEGLDNILAQQKSIGRNLNQLTMLANMNRISVVHLDSLIRQHIAMQDTLKAILERRRWSK